MIFRPFLDFEHGCAAYLFGCGGQGLCAVVDARESEVDEYVAFASAKGMRITRVLDTHVHADPFTPVDDDEEIGLGNTRIRVLHTPGHTPESISLVVTDLRRGPQRQAVQHHRLREAVQPGPVAAA